MDRWSVGLTEKDIRIGRGQVGHQHSSPITAIGAENASRLHAIADSRCNAAGQLEYPVATEAETRDFWLEAVGQLQRG